MAMFEKVSEWGGPENIVCAATEAIEKRKVSLSIKNPWSTAELRLDQADYCWLIDWLRALYPGQIRRLLRGPIEVRSDFGLLVILASCETIRREGSEGETWNQVRLLFCDDSKDVMFNRTNRDASQELRDLIRTAAVRKGLRNVFGAEGLQEWHDSLRLQLGFTFTSVKKRLPDWLAGYPRTLAVSALLEGPQRSDSFCSLWNSLKEYGRENVTEERIRRICDDSPWVLSSWTDELLKAARNRPPIRQNDEDDGVEDTFISDPSLHWDGGVPVFRFSIENLVNLERLTESAYRVELGGRCIGVLQRQDDSSYSVLAGGSSNDYFRSPANKTEPTAIARIVKGGSDCGQESRDRVEYEQLVRFWDPLLVVNAFSLANGKKVNLAARPLPSSGASLVISSDLDLIPEAATWHGMGNDEFRVYLVDGPSADDVCVQFNGNEIWRQNKQQLTRDFEPAWSSGVSARMVSRGGRFNIRISCPSGVEVTFARCGQALKFENTDEGAVIRDFKPSFAPPIGPVSLTIGTKFQNAFVTLRREVEIPDAPVAVVLGEAGWQPLAGGLTQLEASHSPVWLNKTPTEIMTREWALVEGDLFLRRLRNRIEPVGQIGGYGAALQICRGPYNRQDSATVSEPLVDTGIIEGGPVVVDGAFFELEVDQIEPDDKYKVFVWGVDGFSEYEPRYTEEGKWAIDYVGDIDAINYVAVSYDGTRVGGISVNNWEWQLENAMPDSACKVAQFLRWAKLPLIDNGKIRFVREFAIRYAEKVLPIWLANDEALAGTALFGRFDGSDEHWYGVIRVLFSEWIPTAEQADIIASGLSMECSNPLDIQTQCLRVLGRADPILWGKFLRVWHERGISKQVISEVTKLVHFECGSLDSVGDNLKVDEGFVERGLVLPAFGWVDGDKPSDKDQQNIRLAVTNETFRRFLTMRIFDHVTEK